VDLFFIFNPTTNDVSNSNMQYITKLIIVIIFASVTSTNAQVRIGVFGGINSTNFNGDDPPNANFASEYGYNIGASADFYVTDDIAINAQPMYSSQSTVLQYDVTYQYDKYDSISVINDYIEIPVNIKIIANNQVAYVTAGLSLAIPLSSSAKNNSNGNTQDIIDRYETYVILANFGVGIQFSIGKPMLFIELQYSQSLTNLTQLVIEEIEIKNKLKSNGFHLQTGILFNL
jgi:hypothetical protein